MQVVSPAGALLRTVSGARFTGASIDVPDLDGDGIDDLVAVIDEPPPCPKGQECPPFGAQVALRAIGTGTGATLWTYPLPRASLEAGRSNVQLATIGNVVAIGDPSARDSLGRLTGGITFVGLDASTPQTLRVTYAADEAARLGATVSVGRGGFMGGAPGANNGAGALELLEASGRRVQRIVGGPGVGLGSGPVRVVALAQGDLLVAGNPGGSSGASVSVMRWNGTLVASYAAEGTDALGSAVSDAVGSGGELLIGAPSADLDAGAVYLLDLVNGTLTRSFTGFATDRLGAVVATVGDVTGDGIPEIAIGRPGRPRLDGGIGTTVLVRDTSGVFRGEPL